MLGQIFFQESIVKNKEQNIQGKKASGFDFKAFPPSPYTFVKAI